MDIKSLLQSLNAHKVKYVIIDAAAFPPHGYSRVTMDIDVFIQASRQNAMRTLRALKDVGYDVTDVTIEQALEKKLLFRQYVPDVDIHPHVKGVQFARVWRRKVEEQIHNTRTYFASLRDLIRMKKAAGRPKDIEDLRILQKLQGRQRRKMRARRNMAPRRPVKDS